MTADCLNIDDRSRDDLNSSLGPQWRLVSDQVMGGVSRGTLIIDRYQHRSCLRMRGDVSTAHNGGFLQMALSLSDYGPFDASDYTGIQMDIAGNNESYNLHLRTADLSQPWQSYRSSFTVTDDWQSWRFPFNKLEAYRTTQAFNATRLLRIGLVAIGRNFAVDLCMAAMTFYREE